MLLSSNPALRARQPRSAGVDVVLSTHALDRYREHSGRELSVDAARRQLAGMWEHVEITASRPTWLYDFGTHNELYAVIADVVFPLRQLEDEPNTWLACTTIFKGAARRGRTRQLNSATKSKRRKPRSPRHRHHGDLPWAA